VTQDTGDKTETVNRDPAAIQAEIESTRAELARTVDLIAERLSPRRAASRGVSKVRAGIDGVLHHTPSPNGTASSSLATGPDEHTIHSVPLPADAPARSLRKDRVAIVAGAVVVVTAVIVIVRRRR
jgi:hypothetical protein